MHYLLDTQICRHILIHKPVALLEKLQAIPMKDISVSVMTVAELRYGVETSQSPRLHQRVVDDFLVYLSVLPWSEAITPLYAKIRCAMETQGTPMGQMDLMIAAQALQAEAILVTQNPKPFSRVPDLKLELWGGI